MFLNMQPASVRLAFFTVIALVIIQLALWAAIPSNAAAYTVEKHPDQVTGQIVISPTKYDLRMDPGETASQEIVVVNRTGITQTIEFYVEDFEGSSDPSLATVFLGEEDGTWGARHWIEPELRSIVLNHGETLTFTTKVTVPDGAEPGGHYASLFASSNMEDVDEQGSVINITSRVGCLFLITVSGNMVEEGNLSPLELPTMAEYGPTEIGLVFNNTGNVHLRPSGRIIITNILGQTVADIPVQDWVVLPESSRRNIVEWDTKYLFGRYTVKAEITYGAEGQQTVISGSFWGMPWKLALAGLAVLAVLVALLSFLVHRKRQARRVLAEEVEQLRNGGTVAVDQSVAAGADPAGATEIETMLPATGYIKLDALFPSMNDARVIDLADSSTQKLVMEMINSEIDLARSFLHDGDIEQARQELLEARKAAQIAGFLAEVGVIDDMLRGL